MAGIKDNIDKTCVMSLSLLSGRNGEKMKPLEASLLKKAASFWEYSRVLSLRRAQVRGGGGQSSLCEKQFTRLSPPVLPSSGYPREH